MGTQSQGAKGPALESCIYYFLATWSRARGFSSLPLSSFPAPVRVETTMHAWEVRPGSRSPVPQLGTEQALRVPVPAANSAIPDSARSLDLNHARRQFHKQG